MSNNDKIFDEALKRSGLRKEDLEKLKNSGDNLENALKIAENIKGVDAGKLKSILSDEERLKSALSSPQAKKLMEMLSNGRY